MRIISCILLFCLCSFSVYADDKEKIPELKNEIEQLESQIKKLNGKIKECEKKCSDLENKKGKLKAGDCSWKYPLGIPEDKIDEQKAEIDRDIQKVEGEITKHRTSIEEKRNSIKSKKEEIISIDSKIKLCISKIEITCKKRKFWDVWKYSDKKPDIYLKIKGYKICSVQEDSMNFSIAENDVWTAQKDKISFTKGRPITIEVWDNDLKYDNKLFNIHINGKNDNKYVEGEKAGFKYRVEWREIEK